MIFFDSIEKGKDERTIVGKFMDWVKIIWYLFILGLVFFTALYFTNNRLVVRVETAQTLITPEVVNK